MSIYTATASLFSRYLQGFLVVLAGRASVGCVLPVRSSQKVQLDCVLGHPVLELVK